MSAQHTPGPFAQTKRPSGWGVPSTVQYDLLVRLIEKGGSGYHCASIATLKACMERGWLELVGHEGLARITAQGKASVYMNSKDADAAEAAIAKATGSAA